jgi:hypothetical protein
MSKTTAIIGRKGQGVAAALEERLERERMLGQLKILELKLGRQFREKRDLARRENPEVAVATEQQTIEGENHEEE